MAKYFGKIGYGETIEDPPNSGIRVDQITEKEYYGDLLKTSRSLNTSSAVIGDISISNSISVIADAYAIENFMHIRYIEWAGTLWTVTNIEVLRPRLILTLGGVYNGPTP